MGLGHIPKIYPTEVETMKVLGWVWEGFGGVGGWLLISVRWFPGKINIQFGILIVYYFSMFFIYYTPHFYPPGGGWY